MPGAGVGQGAGRGGEAAGQPLAAELAGEAVRRAEAEACLAEMRQFNTAVLEQAQARPSACKSRPYVRCILMSRGRSHACIQAPQFEFLHSQC